jgi:hypothetical protein
VTRRHGDYKRASPHASEHITMRTLLASILALAGTASAQCGTLSFLGAGTAGSTLTVDVSGTTAGGLVVLFVGQDTGTTTIDLGPLSLTFGLDTPFFPVPLGRADANGHVSRGVTIPTQLTTAFPLNAQHATFTLSVFPFSLDGCTGNVAAFSIGG